MPAPPDGGLGTGGGASDLAPPPGRAPVPLVSRRLSRSALVGLVAWSALLFVRLDVGGALEFQAHLVLVAPLVLVPLLVDAALPFTFDDRVDPALVAASWLVLPGALAAAASFLVPAGTLAGALVLPWGLATVAVAGWGLRTAWDRWRVGGLDVPEGVLAVGLASLPGGAAWLFAARTGGEPGPLVALLGAAHVHYAAFAAAVWSGLLGRALAGRGVVFRRVHAAAAVGLVAGFWLGALGAAAGGGTLETLGGGVLAASAVATGGLGVALGPALNDRSAGLMVAVSGGALALAMGLSLTDAGLGPAGGAWTLPRHGWLDAVGFGLWGALGWRRLRPRPAPLVAGGVAPA